MSTQPDRATRQFLQSLMAGITVTQDAAVIGLLMAIVIAAAIVKAPLALVAVAGSFCALDRVFKLGKSYLDARRWGDEAERFHNGIGRWAKVTNGLMLLAFALVAFKAI